jgi:integrase
MVSRAVSGASPNIVNSPVGRTREYFTPAEIERLMATARKSSRYGHRDATMILIAYRHGLRASELCNLQWHRVELAAGRLHVRRTKRGRPVCIQCRATRSALCGVYSASKRLDHTSLPLNVVALWRRKAFTP